VAFKIASAAIPAQLKLDDGANDENKLRIYLKTQSNTIPQLIVNVGNMVSAATHPLAAEIGRAELQLACNSIVLVSIALVSYVISSIY
jgi:hypothetical protein